MANKVTSGSTTADSIAGDYPAVYFILIKTDNSQSVAEAVGALSDVRWTAEVSGSGQSVIAAVVRPGQVDHAQPQTGTANYLIDVMARINAAVAAIPGIVSTFSVQTSALQVIGGSYYTGASGVWRVHNGWP